MLLPREELKTLRRQFFLSHMHSSAQEKPARQRDPEALPLGLTHCAAQEHLMHY